VNKITVKKSELLEALRENKDRHRKIFDEAQKNFRQRIIEELDQRLTDAQEGRKINLSFNFPEPEDHTKDYDRVIRMVEMSQDDTLDITQPDFAQYVMDDWDWRRAWVANTLSYTQ
jgi:hypothetical protein